MTKTERIEILEKAVIQLQQELIVMRANVAMLEARAPIPWQRPADPYAPQGMPATTPHPLEITCRVPPQ